jgi:hypothetical protein
VRLGPGARDWHGRFRASRGTGCLTPRRSAPGHLLNPLLKPRKTSPPGKERDPESESRAVSGAGQGRLPARRGSACGRSPRRVRPSRRGEAPPDGGVANEGRTGARAWERGAQLPAVQPARALGSRSRTSAWALGSCRAVTARPRAGYRLRGIRARFGQVTEPCYRSGVHVPS